MLERVTTCNVGSSPTYRDNVRRESMNGRLSSILLFYFMELDKLIEEAKKAGREEMKLEILKLHSLQPKEYKVIPWMDNIEEYRNNLREELIEEINAL